MLETLVTALKTKPREHWISIVKFHPRNLDKRNDDDISDDDDAAAAAAAADTDVDDDADTDWRK